MEELSAIENVVRVIFPSTMMNEGELLPAAFKLRERAEGAEQYISVFRQYAESFQSDILHFDKQRNLPCCIMNVGEVNSIKMHIEEVDVVYSVKAVPTNNYASHAGIFVNVGGALLEGDGKGAFSALNIGKSSKFYMMAIRHHLVEIAKRRMTNVLQFAID